MIQTTLEIEKKFITYCKQSNFFNFHSAELGLELRSIQVSWYWQMQIKIMLQALRTVAINARSLFSPTLCMVKQLQFFCIN